MSERGWSAAPTPDPDAPDRAGSFVPYPPIAAHGLIGDRRTAALVAADGTLDWLCVPTYGDPPVFGALLDAERGGAWRLGPAVPTLGRQEYRDESLVLTTTWTGGDWALELTDAMAWPVTRPAGQDARHAILRRLRCTRDAVRCRLDLAPRDDFGAAASVAPRAEGAMLHLGDRQLRLWASCPLEVGADRVTADVVLRSGDMLWAVLDSSGETETWTIEMAEVALAEAVTTTREWAAHAHGGGARAAWVRRSAQLFHLLTYAPAGSVVAAPTTSLPERIGGDRNYDYRYAWVRDASLAAQILTLLGDAECAESHLDWLVELDSGTDAPLQVVYRVDGRRDLDERERPELAGYRGSRPVRVGNRAYLQHQLDSLGCLTACVWTYLDHGGTWREPYWDLIRRAADFTGATWQTPDSGIWELPESAHYVSSKVMSWSVLDRAVRIAERLGRADQADGWRREMPRIHADVMEHGWSERLGSFVQRYGAEALDASALLIPIIGFLPATHPRVAGTIALIQSTLAIGGLVHRFEAAETPSALDDAPKAGRAEGGAQPPPEIGRFEGAFLPTTFWLASAHALAGRPAEAEAILARAEASAGELGLFAESVDAQTGAFLGNYPLLFAQMEYVRAVLDLDAAERKE